MDNFKKFASKIVTDKRFIIILIILAVLIVAGIFIYNKRYSPSNETMTLNEYYEVKGDEMAVIIDGELLSNIDGAPDGIVRNNTPYVKCKTINDAIKDVYAYDNSEHKVSFTTTEGTYRATAGANGYTYKGQTVATDYPPLVEENGTGYIALGFVKDTTDTEYTFNKDPARAAIYTPGTDRTKAEIDEDIEMRRFGGNRSKILATAKKGDRVTVVENYGSWSQVLTEDGILGCVPNSAIDDKDTVKNKTGAAQDSLSHNHMNEPVRLGWHQAFSSAANGEVESVVSTATGMNVISPTWLQIKDNKGSLNNLSNANYVNFCHGKGIKVWVLVSNIERDVDENQLFNVTSTRDALVNNIVSAVTAVGADGINVDMESVGDANVDGYTEFIKTLALKCKENNLVLSVDNYNVNSADYNVDVQARFTDYVVLFGYDETWTGAKAAGSNNSINWVKKGVEGMLAEGVDKSQLILAIPFYTRVWIQSGDTLTSETVTLKDTPALLQQNNATANWLKENKENYAEWTNGDKKYSIWIVDNKSLQERVNYVMEKKLAGIAAWKLGNETPETWKMISDTVR